MNKVILGDSKVAMRNLDPESVQLLWTDPPFGTNARQQLDSTSGTSHGYKDVSPKEAIELVVETLGFAEPALKETSTVAICVDYRIVHDLKVAICKHIHLKFEGEIIHHSEMGGTSRSWWTNKHNTVLLFSKGNPIFNPDEVPHVKRKAPRGAYTSTTRPVNSVWSITMGPSDPQRTGYPNQKPVALVEPFIRVHTDPGDLVIDPFAGSGTVGVACKKLGRNSICVDSSPEAVQIMLDQGLTKEKSGEMEDLERVNMNESQLDQALHNVGYHPPKDPKTGEMLGVIRESFALQLKAIDSLMPDGREKALCYTHIEEACMYAMAAVVRNQDSKEGT